MCVTSPLVYPRAEICQVVVLTSARLLFGAQALSFAVCREEASFMNRVEAKAPVSCCKVIPCGPGRPRLQTLAPHLVRQHLGLAQERELFYNEDRYSFHVSSHFVWSGWKAVLPPSTDLDGLHNGVWAPHQFHRRKHV
jgi:hypothetical protein